MSFARVLASLAAAVRRPARRVPWLRLVLAEATPPTPGGDEDFLEGEDWEKFPTLKEAAKAWETRKVLAKPDFEGLADAAKGRAFTAARVATNAGLRDTLVSLQKATTEGLTVREWREKYWDEIQKKFGKAGGTAPWYTATVFRTNQQAAFAAGRYAEMFDDDQIELQPLVRFSAILDARVRPEHAALHDLVFSKTDPFARRYFPPIGFNCRCHLEAVSPDENPDVTNGASLPDLKLPNGKFLGPPPKGWNTDRVDSLVESFHLKNLSPMTPPAPKPIPFPSGPKFGEPGWIAPNGLTQEMVDEAFLWNPKATKVKLNPDGSIQVKYQSGGWGHPIDAEKAPGVAQKSLAKKGTGPKPAPIPKAPVEPVAPPAPPPPPVPKYGDPDWEAPNGLTQAKVDLANAGKGHIKSATLQPDGSVKVLYTNGQKHIQPPEAAAKSVNAGLKKASALPGFHLFPCDDECPPPPGPVRRRGAPPLNTTPTKPDTGDA